MKSEPLKTFIIYSREDEKHKNHFLRHLKPLSSSGLLDVWHDGNILPGEEWENEIKKNLEKSDLVLVLVSVNSLNSEFIQAKEISMALEQFTLGTSRIVPIVVSPCVWYYHPVFRGLQGLPQNMKPINSWENVDEAWTDVVHKIAEMLQNNLLAKQESSKETMPVAQSKSEIKSEEEGQPAYKPAPKLNRPGVSMVSLEIVALSQSSTSGGHYAVVLGEKKGVRRLPVVIGGFEAQAIAIAIEKKMPDRPLTHDLIKSIIITVEYSVKEVIINNLLDGVFYARIVLEGNGEIFEVDSRFSDALAIAARFECPIYTYEFIMAAASVVLEEEEK